MRTIRINFIRAFGVFTLYLIISGCTSWLPEPHRIDIEQGNIVTQIQRDSLVAGMTKDKVQKLLGEAILKDPFHSNRWDYIYRLKSDDKKNMQSRLTLYFKGDSLSTIDDSEFKPSE